MFRIKRTKGIVGSFVPPAVHYAVTVATEGNVTGWTELLDKAGEFDAATVEKVQAYYLRRENVGKLEYVPIIDKTVVPEPVKPVEAEKAAEPPPPIEEPEPEKPEASVKKSPTKSK